MHYVITRDRIRHAGADPLATATVRPLHVPARDPFHSGTRAEALAWLTDLAQSQPVPTARAVAALAAWRD